MQMAKYNSESGEVSLTMDEYISVVEVGDEFNLENKQDLDEEAKKEDKKEGNKPNPNLLKQQLQIHDNAMVSIFQKVQRDDETAASSTLL